MARLSGLPALDRTLLPKPCTDLRPDGLGNGGGGGEGVVSETGLLGPHLEGGHLGPWGRAPVGKGPTGASTL